MIRQAYKALPPMSAMRAYLRLSEQFGLSDETIRQILRKKHPPNWTIGEIHQQLARKSSNFAPWTEILTYN